MRISGVTWSNSVPPIQKPSPQPSPATLPSNERPSTRSFAPSFARDDGTHLGREVGAVEHLQRLGALDELGDHLVRHVAHQHRHADRHAALAGRAVARADKRIHRLVDVRIGHDHHVVLRAAQRLHALAVVGAGFIDVVGNGRGADEAHGLDVGVLEQRIDRGLVALHHVEHAIGQARFLQQLGHAQRRGRVGRAGLEHEGVARGNGHREHPHRHHHREVERRDAGHHAERLAQRPVVDAGRDLVGEIALEQLRDAARELDDVDAARHFALRIGEHLAVLGGDHVRQLILVQVQQFQELEHHAGAADRRRVGPLGERGLRGGHRGIDVGRGGKHHLARDLAGRGVGDVLRAGGTAGGVLAADEMGNLLGHWVRQE
jgi:hypothetical protein